MTLEQLAASVSVPLDHSGQQVVGVRHWASLPLRRILHTLRKRRQNFTTNPLETQRKASSRYLCTRDAWAETLQAGSNGWVDTSISLSSPAIFALIVVSPNQRRCHERRHRLHPSFE